jgi:hypothetical protein
MTQICTLSIEPSACLAGDRNRRSHRAQLHLNHNRRLIAHNTRSAAVSAERDSGARPTIRTNRVHVASLTRGPPTWAARRKAAGGRMGSSLTTPNGYPVITASRASSAASGRLGGSGFSLRSSLAASPLDRPQSRCAPRRESRSATLALVISARSAAQLRASLRLARRRLCRADRGDLLAAFVAARRWAARLGGAACAGGAGDRG